MRNKVKSSPNPRPYHSNGVLIRLIHSQVISANKIKHLTAVAPKLLLAQLKERLHAHVRVRSETAHGCRDPKTPLISGLGMQKPINFRSTNAMHFAI